MTQAERKLALLGSTISVIARDGLDKTTTRAIATEANLNEAYIYQLFDSKEDLSEINLTTVNWTDTNVEPSGDNGVELFIKYKVNKVTGDSTTSVGAGLFKFNVGIN